ncbi:hypothetical protein AQ490_23870 [Wenjunlia vitaminophila]|uniref:DUF742 domain-containing protein n=1 Tax=Wenjunlia vitaminophila TaxID=76728 RepID=A0A0T6LRM1_WENVI|nr:DUF742 domain-containing protein [Wenjunlia vitaminophila]KRV48693.1 hypothetical protein AQ490_23870 [Wenjunlia vitaminophila]
MPAHGDRGANGGQWYDDEAGPVVRPYAMTRGRTRSAAEDKLDLIALVVIEPRAVNGDLEGSSELALAPEHQHIIELCMVEPMSVAELAADTNLPVGVVRVLLGDLLDAELVRVRRPVPPAQLPDERILREVINGLRAL